MRLREELARASGYANRPQDLDHLLRALDHDLRLITPIDPEGKEAASPVASASARARGADRSPAHHIPTIN